MPLSDGSEVGEGETVYALGFPMSDVLGDRLKVSEGIVNSIAGIEDDPTMFQISIPIQPGNSGGPLITSRGVVVGVVTSSINQRYMLAKTNNLAQNVNFAVKASLLLNLKNLIASKAPVSSRELGEVDRSAKDIMAKYRDGL